MPFDSDRQRRAAFAKMKGGSQSAVAPVVTSSKDFRVVKAFQPTAFEKNVYAVQFVRRGKPLVDRNIRFFQVRANSRAEAIQKARRETSF